MSKEFLPLPMAAAVAYLRLVSLEDRGPVDEPRNIGHTVTARPLPS